MKQVRTVSIAMMLAMACLASAPHALEAADPPRPFGGGGEGVVVGVDVLSAAPLIVNLIVEWEGEALHLGHFTRRDDLIINFSTGELVGTKVFTAANGDELWVDTVGSFDPAAIPTPEDPLLITGEYFFTGGTGRFEDASGEATFEVLTPDFVVGVLSFEGTLEY